MPGTGAPSRGWWQWPTLLLAGITLLGLAVRLPSLNDSLAGDELSTYFVVTAGHTPHDVLNYVRGHQEISPPLFFELAWLTNSLGHSVETLRLPSLLAGIGAIPITYLVGATTAGRRPALIGAALVALSPFLIFYSSEARAYMLDGFLLLASTYALLRATEEQGRPWWWVIYGAAACAAVYTHYTAIFVLGVQFAFFMVAWPKHRVPLSLASLGAAVAFIPWVPDLRADGREPGLNIIDLIHPFTFDNVRADLGRWAVSTGDAPISRLPGGPVAWLIVGGVAAGLVGLAARIRRDGWHLSRGTGLIAALSVAAPVGAVVYSAISVSVFLPRNLIGSWPYAALVAGALVSASPTRWLRWPATLLLLGGFAFGAAKMTDPANQRPDFEAAARYIDSVSRPRDPVVDASRSTGPQSPLEAQLAPYGRMFPRRPVFNLQMGRLRDRLREREPGGLGPFAPIPTLRPAGVAKRASRLARGGHIYLVAYSEGGIGELRVRSLRNADVAAFLEALPPGYAAVASRRYPGLGPLGLYVFTLADRGA